jgi:catechol 2,3-dioxygenase-like lactoylglutathione lyase family enzyme
LSEPDGRVRPAKLVFVVPTTDLAASIAFYRDGIGLELLEEWEDPGRGAILRGAETAEIELLEVEAAADPPEPRTTLGLLVQRKEVDDMYERLERAGARLKAAPRVRAWGMRGFGVFDPSGVPVNIYAPVEEGSRTADGTR